MSYASSGGRRSQERGRNEEEEARKADRGRRRKRTKERSGRTSQQRRNPAEAGSDEDVEDEEDGRRCGRDVCGGKGPRLRCCRSCCHGGAGVMADANGDMELSHIAARRTCPSPTSTSSRRPASRRSRPRSVPRSGTSMTRMMVRTGLGRLLAGSTPAASASSSSSSVVSEVLVGVHLCGPLATLLALAAGLGPRCRARPLPCCLGGASAATASAPPEPGGRSSSGGCNNTPAVALLPCLTLSVWRRHDCCCCCGGGCCRCCCCCSATVAGRQRRRQVLVATLGETATTRWTGPGNVRSPCSHQAAAPSQEAARRHHGVDRWCTQRHKQLAAHTAPPHTHVNRRI